MEIRLKRVYEPAEPGDGARFLVERLWPRGVRRTDLVLTAWLKEVAPSPALRQWYHQEPERWPEFRSRYLAELAAGPPGLDQIRAAGQAGPVTLLYSKRDPEQNSAAVLREFLLAEAEPPTAHGRGSSGGPPA